ncbi:MAG: hypothetical protein PUB80_01545, partial [Clostridiales bacterium]|nr:hypothetical protein [Clostridiales bacterium]
MLPEFNLSKSLAFLTEGDYGLPQRTRCARTFAGREVFFPPHMSPEKMIEFSFAAPAAKLCEAFFTILVQGAGLLPEFLLCKKHSKLKMCHF